MTESKNKNNFEISLRTSELFDCKLPYLKELFEDTEYPWEIIPKIKEHITDLLADIPEGFTLYAEGVLVGEGCKIHPLATIEPPCVIGEGCELRTGAYLRGNVILGRNCTVGNSSELKNCILLDGVQVPHYNYVGDSVLGNLAHMGAGAVCSNLKADKSEAVVHADIDYHTELQKLGAILGDGADIGCGCVLNPATVVGKNTSVYPLTALRGVYPADCIVKGTKETVKRK